ncbi:MAG: 4Fe-4S binding protein [Elusimicrobiota bacterium]|nr:4Fe-4S binding protein [Elusimicrobiota bacterium]
MYLIDLDKCYGCRKCLEEVPGFFTLVEAGIREIVCRKCLSPNCVEACPEKALEMVEGKLKRYTMKCVSCKQCSYACPVGANPSSVLGYRTYPAHINIERVLKVCKKEAVTEVDEKPEGAVKLNGEFSAKAAGWQ